jgi:hypothetical protein
MVTQEKLTFETLFKEYKPKEEFSILAKVSEHTGKFVAFVYKKVTVGYKRDEAELSIASISTADFNEYLKLLKPYIRQR